MLIKYGARNFYCFKEGIEVSFELPSNCPVEISKGKPVSNLICVKGANGSGKTNLLKILSFLKDFCTNSFNKKPDEIIYIHSYFNNDDPIDLFCDFEIDGIEYSYEVSLNQEHIISETLKRSKKRVTTLFKREGNKLIKCIKEYSDLKKVKLRSNASIISTANQYMIDGMKPIYGFFFRMMSNVSWAGRDDFPTEYKMISKYYNDHPEVLEFAIDIIKKCDLGINNISIIAVKGEDGKDIYYPLFEHDADVESKTLTFIDQSSGTRELYTILPYYQFILYTGGVLILDEFDINLHPHILPMIVKLFDNEDTNPKNAQMVFSTHIASIIDYMKKYRLVIVNKEKCESYAYRLDEIPGDILRNDRPISPIYNAGKIGGVPKV